MTGERVHQLAWQIQESLHRIAGTGWTFTENTAMLGFFVIGMLGFCSLILLAGWATDAIRDALDSKHAAGASNGPKGGQSRVRSRRLLTPRKRGAAVIPPSETAIIDLAIESLHGAIPRVAARIRRLRRRWMRRISHASSA